MANDLKILITSSLNKSSSITEINKVLKQIEKDPALQKLNVGITVNSKQVTDAIKQISEQMKTLQRTLSNMTIGNSLGESQNKLTQSLKNIYNQGLVNEKFFQNFNKVINSAKNVEEIDKVRSALQRVNDVANNKSLQQSLLSRAQGMLKRNTWP
jgi:uncharacterized protein YqgV (UPF0045/DUF77 family)